MIIDYYTQVILTVQRNVQKLYMVVCVISLLIIAGPAMAQGTFEIGPQVGFSKFSGDGDVAPSLGLVARYTTSVKDREMFFGLQADLTRKFASNNEQDTFTHGTYTPFSSYLVLDSIGNYPGTNVTLSSYTEVEVPATTTYEQVGITGKSFMNWSVDIMPRIGYRFSKVSVELAAGLSFMKSTVETSVPAFGLRSSDTSWHKGWKIAPGITYELTENVVLLGQMHYAWYEAKTHSITIADFTENIDIKPEIQGAHFSVLYRF